MNLTPRNSSHIAASGYDPLTRTLTIQFSTGAVYDYHDVPQDVAAGLHGAKSIGSEFMRNVRDHYSHTVRAPAAWSSGSINRT